MSSFLRGVGRSVAGLQIPSMAYSPPSAQCLYVIRCIIIEEIMFPLWYHFVKSEITLGRVVTQNNGTDEKPIG